MFQEMNKYKKQFSQMANGGLAMHLLTHIGIIVYLTLAANTFKKIFKNIDKVFMDDGYIRGTSFRGVRGFWYHSYGTNSALAVIALADLWKVKTPNYVRKKVTKVLIY